MLTGQAPASSALTPAADVTALRFGGNLPEFEMLTGPLRVRRVLVRAQEGQLELTTALLRFRRRRRSHQSRMRIAPSAAHIR